MNRNEFRLYMNEYKLARESNPSLSYWLWKTNKYLDGTDEVTNKEGIYTVKAGDTLSSIANKLLGDSDSYQLLADYNNITDVNRIYVGQQIKLPQKLLIKLPQSLKINLLDYVVLKGDNLTSIANIFDSSVEDLLKYNKLSNPNLLSIGLTLKVPKEPYNDYEPQLRSTDEIKQIESNINQHDDKYIINLYHRLYDKQTPYIIDDKKNDRIYIYRNGKVVRSYKAIHGKNKLLDDMTVTYVDDKGNIKNLAGNLSTPAGIYYSDRTGNYHGAPAFMRRTKQMVLDNNPNGIPASIHARTITEKANTNGCTGVSKLDLKDMAEVLDGYTNIPTYILPVNKENKFNIRNGKLTFKSADISKTPSHNEMVSNPIVDIVTDIDNLDSNQQTTLDEFTSGLIQFKSGILSATGINDDTYNELAKKSIGILGVESNYGERHSPVGNLFRAIRKQTARLFGSDTGGPDYYSKYYTYGANESNNSVGPTQIRTKYLSSTTKNILYNKFGIDIDNDRALLMNPRISALVTMLKLADEYKNTGYNYDKAITSWNKKDSYLDLVKDRSSSVNIYQMYSEGTDGIVDELKSNSRTVLTPEELLYLLSKSRQRLRMSGAITPMFDIQDAADLTPILGTIPFIYNYSQEKDSN